MADKLAYSAPNRDLKWRIQIPFGTIAVNLNAGWDLNENFVPLANNLSTLLLYECAFRQIRVHYYYSPFEYKYLRVCSYQHVKTAETRKYIIKLGGILCIFYECCGPQPKFRWKEYLFMEIEWHVWTRLIDRKDEIFTAADYICRTQKKKWLDRCICAYVHCTITQFNSLV